MLAGLTGVALAPAQSARSGAGRHLLLVPATPEGTAALARTDARVVARYESFSLVEAAGADEERLRRVGAERRDDMRTVQTAAGEIDPSADRRSLAGKEAPERDETLALVQFVGPPKEAWLARLNATGGRVLTYQAENAYVVHAEGAAVERLAALEGRDPAVRAVSVLVADDKLEQRSSPSGLFAVTTVAGAPGRDVRDRAARSGPAVGTPTTVDRLRTQYLALSAAEVETLATDPAVVAIEPYAEPELTDERAAQIVAGNLSGPGFTQPAGPGYLGWLVHPDRVPDSTTSDFAIDMTDEGLDNGADPPAHTDFRELGLGANPDRVSYLTDYTSPPPSGPDPDTDARDCGGHGTNVASIAAGHSSGSGSTLEDAAGYDHGLGVAPFARIGASKIFRGCGDGGFSVNTTLTNLTANAYAAGARISNNSWGTGGLTLWGTYTARAREYDQLVRDARPLEPGNQEMIELFAAGNDGEGNASFPDEGYGTIHAEGTAKNVITVGASEGVRASGTDGCGTPNSEADGAGDIVGFSSRGPTDDGRLKPDLVAPGTHVTGAAPLHTGYTGSGTCNKFFTGTTRYSLVSGTSQATPQVSGAAALVLRRHELATGVKPSPALVKALLISTAADLGGGQNGKGDTIAAGPNTDQGWGRVDVGAAFDSTARELHDQLPGDMLDASGTSVVRSYAVQDTSRPVKVTLAWTDAPGPLTGDAWINNLDLEVAGRGDTYKGNVFAGAFSRPGGSADTRNNVESVYLPAGTSGRFSVTVRGTSIAGNGVPGVGDGTDQDFALVVSNADEQPSPVLVHESTSIDDAPDGDSDGAFETDEEVDLTERVRNAGDVAATGLTAQLSSDSPNLTITQDTSAYPDLLPDESGVDGVPFGAELSNAAACGVDVPATLDITTTAPADTHTIPLSLPTGEPGPSRSDTASGAPLPLPIPDDSAAGVSSSVFVGESGRIRDVNVRILGNPSNPGLEHDWVGDIVIDVTGPDGTRVRLVEHPGGPDNNGKDFAGTTFDDEAAENISTGDAPYTGSFRPQNDQLSRFDGKSRRGTWTLRVRDLFEGDTGTLRTWGVTTQKAVCDIDTTAPETTIASFPGSPVSDTSATFSFGSDDAGATFECRLDSADPTGFDFAPCPSPETFSGLSDGQHRLEVRAVDGSGNQDATPAEHTWVVDTVAPETTIVTGPAAGSFTSSTSASFEFTSEANARFECRLDSAPFAPCSDPQPQQYSGLAEGTHTFRVRAVDLADNRDASPATRTWHVDTTAPAPTVGAPGSGATTQDHSPLVSGTAGTAPGDASTVQVRVFAGTDTSGTPVEEHLSVSRNATTGAWSVTIGDGSALATGEYTVEVRQSDSAGNGPGIATSTFTVSDDAVAPVVTVSAPAFGSVVTDTTPRLAGTAGTAEGDESVVFVNVFRGTLAAGLPEQVLVVQRDAVTGAWSVQLGPLDEGTWTVRVDQFDSAGNPGSSPPVTFTVDVPEPPPPPPPPDPAPSVLLAPAEDRLADVLAGRLTVMAACASRCSVSARLTVSARAARNLGLGGRSTALGRGVKRLSKAGSAAVRVRLTRRARRALRGEDATRATLRVTLEDGERLVLSRAISLRRAAGLRRIAARGLRLWAMCSERCPLAGSLTLSRRTARRIGLKAKGPARVRIASGRADAAAATPKRLTLRVRRGARRALRRARAVRTLLETVARPASGSHSTLRTGLTLRR